MKTIRIQLLVIFTYFALLFPIPAIYADKPSEVPADPVLGTKGKISVWSYTNAFAKRFKLPKMREEGLHKDVWAMEFRIVRGTHDSGRYDCILNVYLNNRLRILYPEGEVGSRETLVMGGRFPVGAGIVTKADRVFHGNQISPYRLKAAVHMATKKGFRTTISYVAYRKYFLSDIAYLSFNVTGCLVFLDPRAASPMFLWVEKVGGRDYRKWTKLDSNDFYHFPLPDPMYKRFISPAKQAARKNREYLRAPGKNHR